MSRISFLSIDPKPQAFVAAEYQHVKPARNSELIKEVVINSFRKSNWLCPMFNGFREYLVDGSLSKSKKIDSQRFHRPFARLSGGW
jgi:hypothetical protein